MSVPPLPPDESDEELFRRMQSGDNQAVSCLVRKYAGAIWGVIRRWKLQGADGDDVYQSTFVKFFTRLDRLEYRYEGGFGALLKKIAFTAARTIHDARTKRERSVQKKEDDEKSLIEEVADKKAQQPVENLIEFEEEAAVQRWTAEEAIQILNEAISQLCPEDKKYFELRHLEGREFHEIQEILDLPHVWTASNRYLRACKRLRKILEKMNIGLDEKGLFRF